MDPANTNILTTVGQARPDQLHRRFVVRAAAHHDAMAQSGMRSLISICRSREERALAASAMLQWEAWSDPARHNFSLSLMKSVALTRRAKLQLSVEAANVFNHRNYEPPNMQVDSSGFGSITALQTAEGAGPRSLELTGRIVF